MAANALPSAPANACRAPGEDGDISDVRDSTSSDTDVARSGDVDRPFNADGAQPRTSALVAVPPPPTAGAQDVMAGEPAEE